MAGVAAAALLAAAIAGEAQLVGFLAAVFVGYGLLGLASFELAMLLAAGGQARFVLYTPFRTGLRMLLGLGTGAAILVLSPKHLILPVAGGVMAGYLTALGGELWALGRIGLVRWTLVSPPIRKAGETVDGR